MAQVGDTYVSALSIFDEAMKSYGLADNPPNRLHHYTSIEVGRLIAEHRDIFLNHCEYSNDETEIHVAIEMIREVIQDRQKRSYIIGSESRFLGNVLDAFDARAQVYEAFVFCMSAGDAANSQDILSMWRAYGRDGKGVCLSFESTSFFLSNAEIGEFRLSRVVYDSSTQKKLIDAILDAGWKMQGSSTASNAAISATVICLVFIMPVMKNSAFYEEVEWRYIFVPDPDSSKDKRGNPKLFRVNDMGITVPYYSLSKVFDLKVTGLPVLSELMIGPSPHRVLNGRSFHDMTKCSVKLSQIPYRNYG